jgi:hypothetical protein
MTSKELYIVDHPKSLNKFLRRGHVLKMIGNGSTRSPGHPSGNQQRESQESLFRQSYTAPFLYTVYHTKKGKNEYMGKYVLSNHTKKVSFEGFIYYEFTFFRYINDLHLIQRTD